MKANDHNQIQRQFDFRHYLRVPGNTTIAQCWFSRQSMFQHLLNRKDDNGTVAVYKLIDFNAHVLVSKGQALAKRHDVTFTVDTDFILPPNDLTLIDYSDTVYQGIGYYVRSIPLTLMVEERLASIDDMTVNPYFAEQHFKDMPLDIIEELERYKLL